MVSAIPIEERDLANQHFDRGLSFDIRGKLAEAIAEMEKAISCDPEFAEAYNKLGDYYVKKGWLPKAIDMFKKSAELKPDIENSHFDLGCAFAYLGRFSESIHEFEKALSLDPTHFEIYGRLGFVHLQIGMFSEAIENLKRALVKDPADIMARYFLGVSFLKVGKNNDAILQFEKVIEHYSMLIRIKDRFAEGHYFIGRCYFFEQKYEKSVEYLRKAVEYDTEEVDFHFSFGMLYNDAEAFASLAESQFFFGDLKAATENIAKAIDLEPNNERFVSLQQKISENAHGS
ncbi:MAG: tetratricopeptide repeat protein [Candidatus Riflebacteria bacterium]|nr:tetratricopeptide repeat protein [Candidatus Riflebacteria bacterium]